MKLRPGDHVFMHFGGIVGGFLDLEGHFFDILVSWGRLSTCLVPWGGLGGKTLSVPAPFWSYFWNQKVIFLRFFFD